MTMYDTNIIIDYLRGKADAAEIIRKTTDERGIGISAISCFELLDGVRGSEQEALDSLFNRVAIYNIDLKAARKASELHRKLRKEGSQLSVADMFIVATAEANNETFVTQDSAFRGSYNKAIIFEK